jgi:hypothetical protein
MLVVMVILIFIHFVLQEILRGCGAVIVNHPGEFSFIAGHCCMIIVHMDAERELCKGRCY